MLLKSRFHTKNGQKRRRKAKIYYQTNFRIEKVAYFKQTSFLDVPIYTFKTQFIQTVLFEIDTK